METDNRQQQRGHRDGTGTPRDVVFTRISDLLDCDLPALLGAAPGVTAPQRRDASTRPNDSQQEPWTGGRVTGVDP